jgi:hypothetical protein
MSVVPFSALLRRIEAPVVVRIASMQASTLYQHQPCRDQTNYLSKNSTSYAFPAPKWV